MSVEWRTVYEVRPRMERRAMSILQPEMGHTGVSQFMQIARMANAFHVKVIPHASIGIGIFQAATSINEATLSFIPKLAALAITLAVVGGWQLTTLVDYTRALFQRIPGLFT